ncbi:putative threonyl-trna synthetase protein [Lasiodiplodia theobromae]|uniref:Threonyl-tRNA synthetase n=1 Tax=Lasiodiplodia theobromae TaxID=45133 RepID=UPI0015C30C1B|nr:Threonyl-tRNA synthetase [Lasiodiplodia theobromae]KAF4545745.1 Threonyl-tRNA synthetase [Lasiodiplodia theobromae]KAF9636290.1 putative threonyl-trna synthetase protein [Lasiodiplodia theobromae]
MDAVKDAVEGVKNLAVGEKQQPKKEKQPKKDKKKGGEDADGRPLELAPPPEYLDHRIKIFEELKAKYDADIAAKPREPINITLTDGKVIVGESWVTSPAEIARGISKSLFERTVISRVDGELWDLERPLEKSCTLELLDFEHPEGKKVFWHSSAHILGEAAERRFGCDLCIGPPVEDGFYYEMALPGGDVVQQTDYKPLEKIADKAIKEKQKFERLTLTKEELLEMFKTNKYKQHIIKDKIPDGTSTTVYRCGPLIDLCRGPHVPHTGRVKFFKIMKNSASYFLGDAKNDSLQRIYGVSFPEKKMMEEHLKYLEEAAKRDHRKIGKEQELFFFHEWSPGSAFFLPHGMIIYNTLQSFLREEYWKRGYQEVQSPNMYNAELWKRSGHWQHYKDDMFTFEVEKDPWALKPMNCPGHCLLFGHRERSYRELPMRIADFGVLHRNEASGALTGLTRVRRFQQDDTHIFCTEDQIEQEITGLFDFLQTVYGKFGFTFKMKLSTRPEGHLGETETWDIAEAKLTAALDKFTAQGGEKWELNPGDGAFYGPKIDITISDALKRDFQCATIQLDFQLPQQFNLEYMSAEKVEKPKDAPKAEAPKTEAPKAEAPKEGEQKKDVMEAARKPVTPGCARPVMIHRAIYGSFERFIAILTEHFAGKWPFWLSPRQILIVPVMPAVNDYVHELQNIFRAKGMHVDVDVSGNTMQKKIRTGQLQQYNFIFVVGAEEKEQRKVNIRNRDDQATQHRGELVDLDVAIEKLVALKESRAIVTAL